MHALTSIAGRENKDKHKPKGSQHSTNSGSLGTASGSSTRGNPWQRVRDARIGCSAVWADTSDRGRGAAVQKSCFSSPQLAERTKPEVASGSLYPGRLALGLDCGDGGGEAGGG